MNQSEKNQPIEEEINLIEYLKVVLKRKKLIFILFLAGLILGGGLFFLLPKPYTTEVTLEVGFFIEQSGSGVNYRPIEDPYQLVVKINSGAYGAYSGLRASNPKGTNLVKIEIDSKKPERKEEVKKFLVNIKDSILNEHNEKIDFRKKTLLEKNLKKLQEKIDSLISRGQQIAALQLEVYNLQRQIEGFQPTKLVYGPVVSEEKTNLFLNLIFGGALGFFVGVCLAFGKEWWDKNRERI